MKPEMLWIDLETTGLRADEQVPLELGLMLTDKWGAEIASWKTLIWEDTAPYMSGLNDMIPFVENMHRQNNLLQDLNRFGSRSRRDAERDAVSWLEEQGVESFTLPMAGSSIGSLDRPFCIEHLPKLHEFFHYRNVDVSTLREVCKMLNPTLWEKVEETYPKVERHRVLEDIQDSITLYRALYENFLFLEE